MKNHQKINLIHFQDYCLAQSSLEDAFLRLSETNDNNAPIFVANNEDEGKTNENMEVNEVPTNNSAYNNSFDFVKKTPSQTPSSELYSSVKT